MATCKVGSQAGNKQRPQHYDGAVKRTKEQGEMEK